MTTKIKIILGFAIMIVLMAVMAVMGYISLQKSSDSFNEYRRLARFSVLSSDIAANTNLAASNVFLFSTHDDPEYLAKAREALKKVADLTKEAEKFIVIEDRRKILTDIAQGDVVMSQLITAIEADLSEMLRQYEEVVMPSFERVEKNYLAFHKYVLNNGNNRAAELVGESMAVFSQVRAVVSRFSQSRDDVDAELAKVTLDTLEKSIKALDEFMVTAEGHRLLGELLKEEETMYKAVLTMDQRSEAYMVLSRQNGRNGEND